MKTALIADVHGNYPALKAVLADAREQAADQYIFLGDYIFDFPSSNTVVSVMRSTDNSFVIAGNKEGYLKELEKADQNEWIYKQMAVMYQTYRELDSRTIGYLTALPEELYIPIGGGKMLYATHYPAGIRTLSKTDNPSADFHMRKRQAPFTHLDYLDSFAKELEKNEWQTVLHKIDADVVAYGHVHLQGYGCNGNKLVINPGSCGMPLDFDSRAPYSLVEERDGHISVAERRIAYDINETIRVTETSSLYEQGEIWCELCILMLRTAKDYFGAMFETAGRIAGTKSEKGQPFTDETWEEAYAVFCDTYVNRFGSLLW